MSEPTPPVEALLGATVSDEALVETLLVRLSDHLDHPELWSPLSEASLIRPRLLDAVEHRLQQARERQERMSLHVMAAILRSRDDDLSDLIDGLAAHHALNSRSPLLQGAMFHLERLRDPTNPKYALAGRICREPFTHLDVEDNRAFLCCSSWLPVSLGDPMIESRDQLWNGDLARDIRASIHDGSYRYCNKIVCPAIQKGVLPTGEAAARQSEHWDALVATKATRMEQGPELVNLAYDKTCNLSCPSCRSAPIAADARLRAQFAEMQERTILPLLQDARIVVITGSGDPFASKNFRQLMRDLTLEAYPDLQFHIMTNAMLLTPRQWESFPALHGRVAELKISVDAAREGTHERLRRGSNWATMLKNLAFAGALTAEGMVHRFELTFVVQADNYEEMGDFVDLAHSVGASGVYFARIQNWGNFTDEEYRDRAVFLSSHPLYEDFLRHMQDPRLRDPIVWLGNLQLFIDQMENATAA